MVSYLDDIIGISGPVRVMVAFSTLTNLLKAFGLPINYRLVQ